MLNAAYVTAGGIRHRHSARCSALLDGQQQVAECGGTVDPIRSVHAGPRRWRGDLDVVLGVRMRRARSCGECRVCRCVTSEP